MKKVAVAVVICLVLLSCAGLTLVEKAKIGVAVSKDSIELAQRLAAVARYEYITATEEGREPAVPYLNDEGWEKFKAIEKKAVAAHELYLESVKVAEEWEKIDPETAKEYLGFALDNKEKLKEVFKDLSTLFDELDLDLGEVFF